MQPFILISYHSIAYVFVYVVKWLHEFFLLCMMIMKVNQPGQEEITVVWLCLAPNAFRQHPLKTQTVDSSPDCKPRAPFSPLSVKFFNHHIAWRS